MQLKNSVRKVLFASEKACNDDKACYFLTLVDLWIITYVQAQNFMDALKKAPTFESVTRVRRKLQVEDSSLSASPEVQKKRWTRAYLMRESRGDIEYTKRDFIKQRF